MKTKTLLPLLLIFGLSCTDNEIRQKKISFLHQVELQLKKDGYPAKINNEGILIIGGFTSVVEVTDKLNEIFRTIGYPDAQFDLNKPNPNARINDLDCFTASDWYLSDDVWCVNTLCIGDESFSILEDYDCFDGTCYGLSTDCIDL